MKIHLVITVIIIGIILAVGIAILVAKVAATGIETMVTKITAIGAVIKKTINVVMKDLWTFNFIKLTL